MMIFNTLDWRRYSIRTIFMAIVILLVATIACDRAAGPNDDVSKNSRKSTYRGSLGFRRDTFLNVHTDEIRLKNIINPNKKTMYLRSVPVRLLGIRPVKDDRGSECVERYIRDWLCAATLNSTIRVLNWRDAPEDNDGNYSIWIETIDGTTTSLNEDLAASGLVAVDTDWPPDYKMMVEGKDKPFEFDWRKRIKDAVAASQTPATEFGFGDPTQGNEQAH